ncbi:DUF1501 domain-containing protein [Marmoricola sp. URHB0036]|uniref:DUF1501 domain-containing protein n=1 Tax=Marmoricola sp. URHB0036 TaxID=1298863 RepID=UPI0003FE73E3|nr:DUF1501 domain-containing protein [Marmoricola sp. URHB0036]
MTENTPQPECCRDFARVSASRRTLLKGALMAGGTMAVTQMFGDAMMQATFAGTKGGNTLVVLSLRGGIDGLGVVVPHGDPGYYTARTSTAVPKASLLAADSMFGLHPNLAPLKPLWDAGELAAIQAVGLAVPNRSHFSAIEAVEDADPGSTARSGWINRMIGLGQGAGTLDGVQLGMNFPTSAMIGPRQLLATTDLDGLRISATDDDYASRRYASLATAWTGATGSLASGAAEAVSISKGAGATLSSMADSTVAYPTQWYATSFAEPLESAAKLIKADLGTDVIAIDAGSWDLHTGYGNITSGTMQQNISGLATSLAAFFADLGTRRSNVTVVTISEFGRRVAENGSRGFDHGWGNMMLVAGAGVKGQQYYGTWTPLQTSVDADLAVTTDYRNVLGEIVSSRFPDRSVSSLFPGLSYNPVGFMN